MNLKFSLVLFLRLFLFAALTTFQPEASGRDNNDIPHLRKQGTLGNYKLKSSHDYTWGWSTKSGDTTSWPKAGAIIISTGADEYIIAGSGIIVTFTPVSPGDPIAGIGSIDEGKYIDGLWVPHLRLNGDQSHQGRHLRIPVNDFAIQKIKLYRYK